VRQNNILIIGGGHNGLVCACYLAAAGLQVTILERRSVVGGAAVTEEFHPGFRNSVASYTVSLLQARIIRELKLEQHGLDIRLRPFSNYLPLADNYLCTGANLPDTRLQFARFSRTDADRLPDYYTMLDTAADTLRSMLLETPPNIGGGMRDILRGLRLGNRLRQLTMPQRRDLFELFTRSAGELLDHWFESDPIKALFGFDSVVGNFASPYAPGSAYVLLHHVIGEANGIRGQWGHAIGGMGAITQAMAREAERRGVTIRVNAGVTRIVIENGKPAAVILDNGEEIRAAMIAANINPALLYLQLIDEQDLEADFVQRMRRYKNCSGSFRINVALSELPQFTHAPADGATAHLQSGIIIAPSLQYMDQAWLDARTTGWSAAPIIEMLIPSTIDDTLAPAGAHVASLFCQHFDPQLPQGMHWDAQKDKVADLIIDTINYHAPNFKRSIVGRMVLSPLDLEREFGLTGGDIFHGMLSLDQLYSARPLLGYSAYRGPLPGLYMCGSGTHPGGGVSGAPGYNAAREIIRDCKTGWLKLKG
jgi:phytoene dehydrogenase-like protein